MSLETVHLLIVGGAVTTQNHEGTTLFNNSLNNCQCKHIILQPKTTFRLTASGTGAAAGAAHAGAGGAGAAAGAGGAAGAAAISVESPPGMGTLERSMI